MKKLHNKYWIIFALIILFSFVLRFYHFDRRVFIFGDSARDVMVARESLINGIIPPIASFSSAGPFVFAPHYYWLIMIVYKFNMNFYSTFYYFLIFQSVLFVGILMLSGKLILNKKFSLFLGLLAASSPRAVMRAMGMSQHAIVAIFAAFALFFIFLFIKKKSKKYMFLNGIAVSLAIAMHYQAIALLLLFLPALIIPKKIKSKIVSLGCFFLGVLIPLLSFLWWDKTQNFANIRNFMDYLFIGQYRIYIANRWTWHLFDFWPSTFADLFGGNKIIGGIILYGAFFFFIIQLAARKLNIYLKYLFLFFLFYFIYLRFYRGEKFEGYLIYLHPFILIIEAFFIYLASKLKKSLFILMLVVFFFNFSYLSPTVQGFSDSQVDIYDRLTEKLNKMTSRKTKFIIYDFADQAGQTETWDASDSLEFYLDIQARIDDKNGVALAFCKSHCPSKSQDVRLVEDNFYFDKAKQIFLLKNPKDFRLVKRSGEEVQNEILFWWKTRPLSSSFDLGKFVYERTLGRFIKQ